MMRRSVYQTSPAAICEGSWHRFYAPSHGRACYDARSVIGHVDRPRLAPERKPHQISMEDRLIFSHRASDESPYLRRPIVRYKRWRIIDDLAVGTSSFGIVIEFRAPPDGILFEPRRTSRRPPCICDMIAIIVPTDGPGLLRPDAPRDAPSRNITGGHFTSHAW